MNFAIGERGKKQVKGASAVGSERSSTMKTSLMIGAAAALSLAGCATTYQLAVMPRDSGKIYTGYATDTGAGQGPVSIDIESKHYAGNWVQVVPDTTYGYISGGFGWGRRGWGGLGTTITMENPAGGAAKALLTAQDGSGLRCDFTIGQGLGGGFCRDDAGRQYDVQMRAAPRA
jgi:hypothetical protein